MLVTLEIVDQNKAVMGRVDMHVFDETHIWKRVAAAASSLKDRQGVRIRVLDQAGGILVMTGAASAALIGKI